MLNKVKKSLGQNFLQDKNIINYITDAVNIDEASNIIEIGPGTGNLTEALITKNPKSLTVIEKDRDLSNLLNSKFNDKIRVINNDFLKSMMKDHYFLAKPPKSTGFEKFNLEWIMKHKRKVRGIKNIDVLATLTYLTISTVSIELSKSTKNNSQLYIYGGGVKNTTVTEGILNQINMRRLKKIGNGIDEKNFESACFAWLALKRLNRKVFIKSNITGREKNGLLGDIF